MSEELHKLMSDNEQSRACEAVLDCRVHLGNCDGSLKPDLSANDHFPALSLAQKLMLLEEKARELRDLEKGPMYCEPPDYKWKRHRAFIKWEGSAVDFEAKVKKSEWQGPYCPKS